MITLHNQNVMKINLITSISILFVRDNVQLKHKCDHLKHCTRVSLGLIYICSPIGRKNKYKYSMCENIKQHSMNKNK